MLNQYWFEYFNILIRTPITVKTTDPTGLLNAIKKAIENKKVVTCSQYSDGDFFHNPEQWKSDGWLKPAVETNEVKFKFILGSSAKHTLKVASGVYEGRFVEMLAEHFDSFYTTVTVVTP